MLLPDHEIRRAIEAGHVGVDPYDPALVQPASIDVRLGSVMRQFRRELSHLDPESDTSDLMEELDFHAEGYVVVHPGAFALACTQEAFTLPSDIAARIEGKGSVGRLGLLVHSTAGWIDPGFTGQVTLELSNVAPSPIILRPGMRIGQLCLFRMSSAAERPYGSPGLGSRYQGQQGPTPGAGGVMTGRSQSSGDDHVLTVTAVREPDSELDDGELEYEIEHHPDCPKGLFGWEGHEWEDWDCDVAGIIRDSSLEFALKYSGTPVTRPGRYVIRAWFASYTSMDFIGPEYDNGVYVVDDEG